MTGNSAASGSAPILRVEGISKRFVKPLGWAERLANRLGASHRETVVQALDDVFHVIGPVAAAESARLHHQSRQDRRNRGIELFF